MSGRVDDRPRGEILFWDVAESQCFLLDLQLLEPYNDNFSWHLAPELHSAVRQVASMPRAYLLPELRRTVPRSKWSWCVSLHVVHGLLD